MLAAFAAGLLPIILLGGGYAESSEAWLRRNWFSVRGTRPVPRSVTIVRIDKPAYDKVSRSPGELFPRKHLADAIERIAASGARLIVLDAVAQRPGDDAEVDRRFAEVLAKTPTVIGRGSETVIDSDLQGNQRKTTLRHNPVEEFAEKAKAVIPMEVRLTNGRVEQISLSSDRVVFSQERIPLLGSLKEFVRGDLAEPSGPDLINYYGPPSTLPNISLAQLVGEGASVPAEYFRDRVVFIGSQSSTGTGAEAGKDSFLTPVSDEWMFGVEIHATIAANLLDATWLRRLPAVKEFLLGSIACFGVALVSLSLSMGVGAIIAAIAAALWLWGSYLAFAKLYYFIPALTGVVVLVVVVVLRWALVATRSGRRRKRRRPTEHKPA